MFLIHSILSQTDLSGIFLFLITSLGILWNMFGIWNIYDRRKIWFIYEYDKRTNEHLIFEQGILI